MAVVAVYFHSRIKKSAELKEINSNFSNVLKQQEELTLTTGQIKNALNKDQINYQIKLNAYHEKSIESISDIYVKTLDLRDAAKDLSIRQTDEVFQRFFSVASTFRRTLDEKKIWVPEKLSSHIEAIAIEIDHQTTSFIIASKQEKYIERMNQKQIDRLIKSQEKFYDYIQQEINTVFTGLAEELSKTVRT